MTSKDDWHGWSRIPQTIPSKPAKAPIAMHIGPLPRRKGIALYLSGEGCIAPLAYFESDAAAHRAMEFLDNLVGLKGA